MILNVKCIVILLEKMYVFVLQIIRACCAPYSNHSTQVTMPAESQKLVERHLRTLCDDIKQVSEI